VTLQAQQPLNNVVRVTVQALAAILEGPSPCTPTRSMKPLPPDGRIGHLALRTSRYWPTRAGSRTRWTPWRAAVRGSPHRPDRGEARAIIEEVDRLGGAAAAVERGFFQQAIAQSAYELQLAQERGDRVVVG